MINGPAQCGPAIKDSSFLSIVEDFMFKLVKEDLAAALERDPSARSIAEVIVGCPGARALAAHRVAHALWRRGWRITGLIVSQSTRFWTGVEIHPGARIGRRVFIDHGMGVVIGETAEVGDDVVMFHGVTLGGTGAPKSGRRHPIVKEGAMIGAGATLLGAITIGVKARVGAGAVVLSDIPDSATAVGVPAKIAGR